MWGRITTWYVGQNYVGQKQVGMAPPYPSVRICAERTRDQYEPDRYEHGQRRSDRNFTCEDTHGAHRFVFSTDEGAQLARGDEIEDSYTNV